MKDHEKEEVMLSKRGLESAVSSNKKELEAQELVRVYTLTYYKCI